MKKRFWALFLAVCVCISSIGAMDCAAAEITIIPQESVLKLGGREAGGAYPTGLLARQTIPVTDTGTAELYQAGSSSYGGQRIKGAAVYTSEWDKYKTYYIYNQLTEPEKEFWDALDKVCMEYLTTNADGNIVGYGAGGAYYALDFVGSTKLSGQEMITLAWMFRYLNPQYYFINAMQFSQTSQGVVTHVAFGMYRAFSDGDTRAVTTKQVKTQADAWMRQVDACKTEEQKVKTIHDLIVNKVDYNDGIYNASFDEETEYSQSAYSVFCMDLTVCAGYSQAFAMVCNAAGIDAISVTSSGHEWNKVRINDSWYNVDCTWSDSGPRIYYDYFERNDYWYDTSSYQSAQQHREEAMWLDYLPECTLDAKVSIYDPYTPGELPETTQSAAKPKASISYKNGEAQVTLSCTTADADIYYTVDGTKPSPASTKSICYTDAFAIGEDAELRAVAVCDTYWDSAEYSQTVASKQEYTIQYVLNGGKNGNNPDSYTASTKTITLKDASRKGYQFSGWYSDKSCTKKVTKIKKGSTGNKKLYAKWTPIKYHIRFKGNKNTSGKMSTQEDRKYGKNYTLPANKYKRSGYTFIGWNTKADGSGTPYGNKEKIKNLADKSGKTVTLYAQWGKSKYKITYKLNGGKNSSKNPSTYTYATKTFQLKNPTRKGYVFKGWYTDKKCTKKVTQIKKGSKGNKVLYAKWKKESK